jgi:hypothetical protein
VWTKVPFQVTLPGDTGCGYRVNGYAGITLLAGWDVNNAAIGYRNLGIGRVYATDFDWQDLNGSPAMMAYTNTLMGYFMTHRK